MDSDRVIGCRKTATSRVFGDTAFSDIVGCFGTEEEAVATKNSVGCQCGTLHVQA